MILHLFFSFLVCKMLAKFVPKFGLATTCFGSPIIMVVIQGQIMALSRSNGAAVISKNIELPRWLRRLLLEADARSRPRELLLDGHFGVNGRNVS